MKRKHFLSLAHALRALFADHTEVGFTSIQQLAIKERLAYWCRGQAQGFDQDRFYQVIETGQESLKDTSR